MSKTEVMDLDDDSLITASKALKPPLQALAKEACKVTISSEETDVYLQRWCSSAHLAWSANEANKYDPCRWKLLQQLRDGKCIIRNESSNLIRSLKDAIRRAQKFSAPEKIHVWLLQGGRKRRKSRAILQPSGNTTHSQKRTGNLLAGTSSKRQK